MTFYDECRKYKDFDFQRFFDQLSDTDISRCIHKDHLTPLDYLALLSPRAEAHLEEMAQKAHRLTLQHFGRVVFLFTPMYLANYCVNQCVYCGFRSKNHLPRKKLTMEEVAAESALIAASGLKHILILTGESRKESPVSYMEECVEVLKKYFTSINIEVYPLETEEYAKLIAAGVDGLSIYQETYNEEAYAELHPAGPKRNYRYRLEAPERGGDAGMRTLCIGALLGLYEWRSEAFFTGLHASYLQDKYPSAEISISPPRMRPHLGGFPAPVTVTDKNLVQYILAFRLFMPRGGITVSTRERPELRNQLIKLGVTRMSAGSCTAVGGRLEKNATGQFDISDHRGVREMTDMIYGQGYQPVFKDWQMIV